MNLKIVTDPKLLDSLSSGDIQKIDEFLLARNNDLQTHYDQIGNPSLLYMIAHGVKKETEGIPNIERSYQYSRLHHFMSKMLLEQGKNEVELQLALEHINTAIEIIQRVDFFSQETLKSLTSYFLYLAVIHKAMGKYDKSLGSLHNSSSSLLKKGASGLDIIMLRRQEVLMRQSQEGFQGLANEAPKYARSKPVEYYSSVKRIFEFAMNSGSNRMPVKMYKEFRLAFDRVKHRLPPLSQISFLKNVAQYLLLNGEVKKSLQILYRILKEAKKRNLHGQERQIINLIQQAQNGKKVKLSTFRI